MKKIFLFLGLLFVLPLGVFAQEEGNTWMFGYCNSIHFTSSGPVYGGVPGTGVEGNNMPFYRSNAACDASGNLLFYVKMKNYENNVPPEAPDYLGMNVYNSLGQAMPNSNLVTAIPIRGPIQLIKKPGNNAQYYVIYSLNSALLSTTVDRNLNGGLGGIVASEKGVLLSGWQTVVGEKTVVIQGCDCIWLVVRSRTANAYKSYRITEAGIDPNPVISECGLLPLSGYANCAQQLSTGSSNGEVNKAGLLKASADGTQVAACCIGGIELYDFSKCSGKLSHARLIDTATHQGLGWGLILPPFSLNPETRPMSFLSACFSPDGSKLYATYFYSRYVYQYDLSQPTVAAVMASKTTVLANRPILAGWSPCLCCAFVDTTSMGDLKRGPDGKIYIGNNSYASCNAAVSNNYVLSQNHALQDIQNPNLPGASCNAQQEAFILGPLDSNKYNTGYYFNPAIVLPPAPRDTLTSSRQVSLCFGGLLQADTPGDCYRWNAGSDSSSAFADTSGRYVVCWSGGDCSYHIDTFRVHVVQTPQLFVAENSCANEATGLVYVRNAEEDTTTFNYQWKDVNGTVLQMASSNVGDTIRLMPGSYSLKIATAAGCDTTLSFAVDALPMPELPYLADTVICRGKYVQFTTSADAVATQWVFGDGNFSTEQNPLHAFGKAGTYYMAVVVRNEAGCSDTADAEIRVNELNLNLSAEPEAIDPGAAVQLHTSADRNYHIVQWKPLNLFPDQDTKLQSIYPKETVVILVKGVSEQGCTDTASVRIYVKPTIKMPTAFSPNGDGLNDYFAPFAAGQRYKVSTFQIFNRLGQMVYDGFGDAAMRGWDGTYKGKPVDAGTYFYRIAVSTEYGELLERKGDVTVIR